MGVLCGIESAFEMQYFAAFNSDTTAAETYFVFNFINSLKLLTKVIKGHQVLHFDIC
jgi:hypothetical protein